MTFLYTAVSRKVIEVTDISRGELQQLVARIANVKKISVE